MSQPHLPLTLWARALGTESAIFSGPPSPDTFTQNPLRHMPGCHRQHAELQSETGMRPGNCVSHQMLCDDFSPIPFVLQSVLQNGM